MGSNLQQPITNINDGMNVKIYDQHQNWIKYDNQYCLVLGVHSFAHFLSQFKYKNNLRILIKGNPNSIIQNILWNQFYSYTLLKDIQRVMFQEAQNKNSFLKINSKTFRMNQCLQWPHFQKIGQQIMKYPNFNIQCFMNDSSIKFINICIDERKGQGFDLIFQYLDSHQRQSKQSVNFASNASTKKNRAQSVNNLSKSKQLVNQKDKNPTKSLFQYEQKNKNKQPQIKYLTEKKNFQTKHKAPKNNQNINNKKSKSKKIIQYSQASDKQNQTFSFKQSSNNYCNYSRLSQNNMGRNIERQKLAADIIYSKQTKINQCQSVLEKKEKQFEAAIQDMEKRHQQQVSAIKKQIQNVLSNYKRKNKDLKRQNECLMQMNHKLGLANKNLVSKVQQLCQSINKLQQGQQRIQKVNLQNSLKIQNLQKQNSKLHEKLQSQQNTYRSQIIQKDKIIIDYKAKYDRLLGNIKQMSNQNKQNII